MLVIDAETEAVRTIECGGGDGSWAGIAAVGAKVFCAPVNASSVLVIDAETEAVRTINSIVEEDDLRLERLRAEAAAARVRKVR